MKSSILSHITQRSQCSLNLGGSRALLQGASFLALLSSSEVRGDTWLLNTRTTNSEVVHYEILSVLLLHLSWVQIFSSVSCPQTRATSNVTTGGNKFLRIWQILTMTYNIQNAWVSGLCPSSWILNIRKHNVSETASVYVLSSVEGDTYSVGFLRRARSSDWG
jgi:hypothetical protein